MGPYILCQNNILSV